MLDAVVSASIDTTHFGKGVVPAPAYRVTGSIPPTIRDIFTPTEMPSPSERVWYANEDVNRIASLDSQVAPGEDINRNELLERRQAGIIPSFVHGNRTGANGQMLIQVTYGQNVASWLAFTLRVSTSVARSEGLAERAFVTSFLDGDLANGSFRVPPTGETVVSMQVEGTP